MIYRIHDRAALLVLLIMLAVTGGWFYNLAIVAMMVTGARADAALLPLHIAGIVLPPLGGILGLASLLA